MYLIFRTYEEADARNRKAITDLNWPQGITQKKWLEIELDNGQWALDVGNGRGLTQEEIEQTINEI
jgi:hypothetical protein